MMRAVALAAGWLMVAPLHAASGQATQPLCPVGLRVDQRPEGVLAPWQATDIRDGQLLPLRRISFHAGPFERGAELKPQRIDGPLKNGIGTIRHHYDFSRPFADGLTVACRYEDTTIAIHRTLPTLPRSCIVTTSRLGPPESRTRAECLWP
ncbi:STY0301 family protein [Nitrosospira briensis]|uniref:STY0301 family protein n=1 Tax=Nitrosospira briensis TaxID=35799 RepID=UPI0008E99312|nr:STY0301 family protein [Nitrosospira briensis]SFN67196.1 hypothetical protein SAMN05216332_101143 [Nitrosospira briensis]